MQAVVRSLRGEPWREGNLGTASLARGFLGRFDSGPLPARDVSSAAGAVRCGRAVPQDLELFAVLAVLALSKEIWRTPNHYGANGLSLSVALSGLRRSLLDFATVVSHLFRPALGTTGFCDFNFPLKLLVASQVPF